MRVLDNFVRFEFLLVLQKGGIDASLVRRNAQEMDRLVVALVTCRGTAGGKKTRVRLLTPGVIQHGSFIFFESKQWGLFRPIMCVCFLIVAPFLRVSQRRTAAAQQVERSFSSAIKHD